MSLVAFRNQVADFQEEIFLASAHIPDGVYLLAMQRVSFFHKLCKHPNADDLGLTSRALRAANRAHYRRFYAERDALRKAFSASATTSSPPSAPSSDPPRKEAPAAGRAPASRPSPSS